MKTVLRFDFAGGSFTATRLDVATADAVGRVRRTPQGGIIVDSRVTRTGVFRYVHADGSVERELRHPDDVFEQASLDSLAFAPVTDDHPDAVTPDNYRALTMGIVAGQPSKETEGGIDYVAAPLRIQDAGAVRDVESRERSELSCGYECTVERVSGVYNGEKYDSRQKNIRYNHVAMGPEGWGRAGPKVRMRLDAGYAVSGAEEAPYVPAMAMTADEQKAYDAALAAVKTADQARLDAETSAKSLKTANETLAADNDRLKLRVNGDPKVTEQARIDAAVEVRSGIVRVADSILNEDGKWTPTGKTNVAIQREVIVQLEPDLKLDGYSDETIGALFLRSVADAEKVRADSAVGSVQRALPRLDKKPAPGADDEDDDAPSASGKAYDAMCARMRDKWKGGPPASNGSK